MHTKEHNITPTTPDWTQTFQLMSWWEDASVKKAKVLVVGAGALGNEVVKNLALMNIGNIVVVDFDNVDYTNLSRSILFRESDASEKRSKVEVICERAKEINSNINTFPIHGNIAFHVGQGLIENVDCVICCVDNRLARLHVNRKCFLSKKTWINGGIENMRGQVEVYNSNYQCYECNLSEADWKHIKYRLGCTDIALMNHNVGKVPTTPISASITAALQVQEALKIIHGFEENVAFKKNIYFNGMNNDFIQYYYKEHKEDCISHNRQINILKAPLSYLDTLKTVKQYVEEHFGESDCFLVLPHSICTEITNIDDETKHSIFCPDFELNNPSIVSADIANITNKHITKMESVFSLGAEHKDKRLKEFGIPRWDMICIQLPNEHIYLSLESDIFWN